jgi:hypothetical protein
MSVEQGELRKDKESESYGLQAETRDIFTEDSLDPVYQVKARILNDALQEIGMGKYQVSDSYWRRSFINIREVVLVPGSWIWLAVVS